MAFVVRGVAQTAPFAPLNTHFFPTLNPILTRSPFRSSSWCGACGFSRPPLAGLLAGLSPGFQVLASTSVSLLEPQAFLPHPIPISSTCQKHIFLSSNHRTQYYHQVKSSQVKSSRNSRQLSSSNSFVLVLCEAALDSAPYLDTSKRVPLPFIHRAGSVAPDVSIADSNFRFYSLLSQGDIQSVSVDRISRNTIPPPISSTTRGCSAKRNLPINRNHVDV